jgi:hypothetical protein
LSDYRNVSIVPVLSKVVKILIRDQILSFVDSHSLLSPFQSGFRKNHSYVTALLKITEDISIGKDNRNLTLLTAFDFSKAFDSLDHNILCHKLKVIYRFSPRVCSFIKSFLCNRIQMVKVKNCLSNPLSVTSGVPQGSVIGPLLFSSSLMNCLTIVPIAKSICMQMKHLYIYQNQLI